MSCGLSTSEKAQVWSLSPGVEDKVMKEMVAVLVGPGEHQRC